MKTKNGVSLKSSTKMHGVCESCRKSGPDIWFNWKTFIEEKDVHVCRECAYREAYGSKTKRKHMKEKTLE